MQSLLYLRHSKTPVKARKRMYEELEPEAFPSQDTQLAMTGFVQAPAEPVQAFAGAPKRFKERRKPKNGGPCTNCSTTMSSMWRPHNSKCALPSSLKLMEGSGVQGIGPAAAGMLVVCHRIG